MALLRNDVEAHWSVLSVHQYQIDQGGEAVVKQQPCSRLEKKCSLGVMQAIHDDPDTGALGSIV
jgi:ribosomal protein S27AE